MSKNENHIFLTDEEMSQAIDKAFTKEGKLLKEATIGLLNSNKHAMNILFKASLGISPKHKYTQGDTVAVTQAALPTWKSDTQKMIEAGILYPQANDSKKMLSNATILEVRHWEEYPYLLEVTIILDSDGSTSTDTCTIKEDYIHCHTEEWPEL